MRTKRTRTVITALAITALVVIAAVVAIVANTPAAKFDGVSVATDGNINLRFYYTLNEEGITKAEAVISDDGITEKITVAVQSRTDNGKTYFSVPLAAAQMGCDVTVTPLLSDDTPACDSVTFSVRDYAEKVLADGDHSSYYSAVKSILNYGTYAHKQFSDNVNNTVIENEGVYSRLTNPVINMGYELGTAEKKDVAVVEGKGVSDAYYTLVLDSYTQIRLYYTYTGEGVTDGIPSGKDNEYYVKIGNISTADYATQYELEATVDDEAVASVQVSVLDCLKTLAADADTADIAHAMYYYYLNTAGRENVPARTDCTHHRQHYEATALGATTSEAVCSFCGKVMSTPVSDSVNYYSAPGQQVNIKGTDSASEAGAPIGVVMTEGDLTFTRITVTDGDAFEFRNGSNFVVSGLDTTQQYIKDANGNVIADSMLGGSGKYVVIKYRYTLVAGSDNQGLVNLTMLSDKANVNNKGTSTLALKRNSGTGYLSYMSRNTWEVYVIDIAKLASNFYGANQSGVKAASLGMTFGYLGSSRTVELDIAYFAICDSFEEIDSIVSEETVSVVDWKNERYAYSSVTATGACAGNHTYAPVIRGNTYAHTCKNFACSDTITIGADINYYSAPGQYYNVYNAGTAGNASCNVAGTVKTSGGVTYQSIPLHHVGYFEFINGTNAAVRGVGVNGAHYSGATVDPGSVINGGIGEYFVVKLRSDGITSINWLGNATDDNGGAVDRNNGVTSSGRNVSGEVSADAWTVYVVKISGIDNFSQYLNGTDSTNVAIGMGTTQTNGSTGYIGTLDVAYFAVCDDWTEIAAVVGNENVKYIENWKSGAPADRKSDGTCASCSIRVSKTNNTYTYKCASCGKQYDEFTMDSSVNYYTAPGQFVSSAWGTTLDANIRVDGDTYYQRFTMTNRGGTMPLTTGGHVKAGYYVDLNGGTGNYLVLRMRTHNITALSWRLGSASDTVAEAEANSGYIGRKDDFVNDKWFTYVVDIKDLLASSSGIKTTYGDAGDTSRTKIVAGFMYGYNSGDINLTDAYVDISYFAVCDNWQEVAAVTRNEKVVSYTAWVNNAPLTEKASDGSCALDCSLAITDAGDTSFTYTCSSCKKTYTQTVDSSVNFYSAPGQTSNNWSTGADQSSNAVINHDIRVENGKVYERLVLGRGASFRFDNTSVGTPSRRYPAIADINGGTGKYIVIRCRVNNFTKGSSVGWTLNSSTSDQANNTDLNASTTNATKTRANDFVNGVWQTYVIDIEKMNHAFYKANDMDATKIAIGMYMNQNNLIEGKSIDFEYVAICDSWSEIDKLVEEDTVLYSGWSDGSAWQKVNTVDGGLNTDIGVDTVGDDAEKVIYQKTGDRMYIYVRSNVSGVDKYTRYEFIHLTDEATKYDSWKILNMDICDELLNPIFSTVVGANECEAAIQEKLNYGQGTAAADFIGGYHGDEYMTSLKVYVDGVELDMSKDYDFTGCESVQAVVASYLNRCSANTETPEKVFDRVKTDTWTKDGLVIHNKFTATDDIFIQRPALSMLAIAFKDGIITEHRNTNLAWTAIPDFQAQNASGISVSSDGVTWAEFRGKINVRVEMSDYTLNGNATQAKGWFSYDYFGANSRRVKIYIEPFYMQQLYEGDVLECTSTQTVFAAE